MGVGISGAIALVFKINGNINKDEHENFLTAYDYDNESKTYTIKGDFIVSTYKEFLSEFYDLIEENEEIHKIPQVESFADFEIFFERNNRNGEKPFLYNSSFYCCEIHSNYYWLFYHGSYKADLEDYSTLVHMERITAKAMNNPLANFVKYGIFG